MVTEEEYEMIKRVQMFEKRKTKTYKKSSPPKRKEGENELGLAAGLTFNKSRLLNPNIWIADSAASHHMTPHGEGMINIHKVNTEATWGSRMTKKATMNGDIQGMICNNNGVPKNKGIIPGVDYILNSVFNLVSVTKLLLDKYTMIGTQQGIILKKGNVEITFDIGICTAKGILYCMFFVRDAEVGNVIVRYNVNPKISIHTAHHLSEDLTRKMAKQSGWKVTRGSLGVCEACTIGKAKRKSLPKTENSTQKGTNQDLDIAILIDQKGKPKIKKPHWCIKVLEPYGIKLGCFYQPKM